MKKEYFGLIYLATNKLNGKRYVGQTITTLKNRRGQHERDKSGSLIHKAILKYGKTNFLWCTLAVASNQKELNETETYYISFFNSKPEKEGGWGYNLNGGGERGGSPSEETRRKRSISSMGHEVTEETRNKLRIAHTGKKHTAEHIEKISAARRGIPRSEETKIKISRGNKGKIMSEESRERMRQAKSNIAIKLIATKITTQEKFIFASTSEAAKKLDIPNSSIFRCLKGRYKQTNGYTFKRL